MEYRHCPLLGRSISRVGFGCAQASGYDYGAFEVGSWQATVKSALEQGVSLFDAADIYGFGAAETLLAEALGSRRHDVTICTKGGLRRHGSKVVKDSRPAWIEEALHGSLRRLKADHVDLYYLHWYDDCTPVEAVLECMARLQQQGKIGAYGASNLDQSLLEKFARGGMAGYQCAYNLLCREPEVALLDWCKLNTIAVIAHSALARGALVKPPQTVGPSFFQNDSREHSRYFGKSAAGVRGELVQCLESISRECGRSPGQVALRWILENQNIDCLLVGAKNAAQMDENIGAMNWQLQPEHMTRLNKISGQCPEVMDGTFARK